MKKHELKRQIKNLVSDSQHWHRTSELWEASFKTSEKRVSGLLEQVARMNSAAALYDRVAETSSTKDAHTNLLIKMLQAGTPATTTDFGIEIDDAEAADVLMNKAADELGRLNTRVEVLEACRRAATRRTQTP